MNRCNSLRLSLFPFIFSALPVSWTYVKTSREDEEEEEDENSGLVSAPGYGPMVASLLPRIEDSRN